jgi:type II secretory pathway component PulF
MNMTDSNPTTDYQWVLRYSSVTFLALVLLQAAALLYWVPQFSEVVTGFGSVVPRITLVAMKSYWAGSCVLCFISLSSTAYILFRIHGAERHLKIMYAISAGTLVLAFAWSALLLTALYQPIFSLGNAI